MVKNGLVKGCSSLAKPMQLNKAKRRRLEGRLLFTRVKRWVGRGAGQQNRVAV